MEGAAMMLEEAQAHYVSGVLRLKVGDVIGLFNGRDGEWAAEITTVKKKQVELSLVQQVRQQFTSPDIWLLFAPIKHGRIDWLVEKATELGVSKLIPILTEYTMVSRVNTDRLRAHAVEAAEQSGRLDVPLVETPETLPTLLRAWPASRTIIYGDENGSGESANTLLSGMKRGEYAVMIGPEAGFSEKERALMARYPHIMPISLGPRVMRADTAALALVTLTQSWLGDWENKPKFYTDKT